MPDIAMCKGGCPMAKTCYRFTARPSPFRQSYFQASPFDRETKMCRHYIKVKQIFTPPKP